MIATLEALVLLFILVGGVLVYRCLIRSQWFARLIGGVVETPPVNDEEVVKRMTTVESAARKRAADLESEAAVKQKTARQMRKKLNP